MRNINVLYCVVISAACNRNLRNVLISLPKFYGKSMQMCIGNYYFERSIEYIRDIYLPILTAVEEKYIVIVLTCSSAALKYTTNTARFRIQAQVAMT